MVDLFEFHQVEVCYFIRSCIHFYHNDYCDQLCRYIIMHTSESYESRIHELKHNETDYNKVREQIQLLYGDLIISSRMLIIAFINCMTY